MSTNHNRIKVADLEKNQPNKILTTNATGELEFSEITELKTTPLASDAETQITATVTEDGKTVSRLKLFNWWAWIRSNVITLSNKLIINDNNIVIKAPKTADYPYSAVSSDATYNFVSATNYFRFGYQRLFWIIDGFSVMLQTQKPTQNNDLWLPNKSGTLATTTDIPSNIITGTGTNNRVSRWLNGALTTGTITDSGQAVGIPPNIPFFLGDNGGVNSYMRLISGTDTNWIQSGFGVESGTRRDLAITGMLTGNEWMRFKNTGGILINTKVDNLIDKLQVNGTVSGSPATLNNQFVTKGQADSAYVAKATIVNDLSTSQPSLAYLNSTYPNALIGFRVHCTNMAFGSFIYEKATTGWLQISTAKVA
jgi:hypothetical protein